MTTPEPQHAQPNIKAPGDGVSPDEHEEAIEQVEEEQMRQENPQEVIEREKADAQLIPGDPL